MVIVLAALGQAAVAAITPSVAVAVAVGVAAAAFQKGIVRSLFSTFLC